MALGSQSGRQIGQGRFMYRKRKGRPGRWLAVILIICGLGGIYWMTRTGPSSLQADGDEPTMLTLDGGTTNEAINEQQNTPLFVNIDENDEFIPKRVTEPIQLNDDSFQQASEEAARLNIKEDAVINFVLTGTLVLARSW